MQKYTVLLLVGKHYSKNFLFAHFTNFWFIFIHRNVYDCYEWLLVMLDFQSFLVSL